MALTDVTGGLLPALNDAMPHQLIPAYEVGGDCFDYNVDADHLDLSSLDAMGHGVGASLLAGLATAVMRNVRRSGGRPDEQIAAADQRLLQQGEDGDHAEGRE